jgi:hypothetical protein
MDAQVASALIIIRQRLQACFLELVGDGGGLGGGGSSPEAKATLQTTATVIQHSFAHLAARAGMGQPVNIPMGGGGGFQDDSRPGDWTCPKVRSTLTHNPNLASLKR